MSEQPCRHSPCIEYYNYVVAILNVRNVL